MPCRQRKTPADAGVEGGAKRARTADLLGAIQALSQLSYGPEASKFSAPPAGPTAVGRPSFVQQQVTRSALLYGWTGRRGPYDTPMRAVVLGPSGEPELADVGEPVPPGELVAVLACGLCGSDVEKITIAPPGTVLGHEVVARTSDGRR